MRLYAITVAYAPAIALARSLAIYHRYRARIPKRHIVVQGHYPINEKKNTNDIKLICEAFPDIEVWDPRRNLGSAQSQNWALQRLDPGPYDLFINLDPDSACTYHHWDSHLIKGLHSHPDCVLVSCMAPMVERYRGKTFEREFLVEGTIDVETGSRRHASIFGIADKPTPFNLSVWRYSFIKEIGGIPQAGLWWGETEGPFFRHCQQRNKFHAYALDCWENENGKFMQDKVHNDYKNLHMRSLPEHQFAGSFEEYLAWKHPELLAIDTCKDLSNNAHP